MPQILEAISKKIEIDFHYIYDTVHTQSEVVTEHQADMVSAYMVDIDEKFEKDDVQVVSYEYNGKMTNVGFAFTDEMDEDIIKLIKGTVPTITEEEINGYLVAESKKGNQNQEQGLFLLLVCIALFCLVVIVVLYIRVLERKFNKNKITDADTGIGNIAYLEKSFGNVLKEASSGEYYIAYIIIDSNYLQLYHSEAVFTDAIKYTASVLKSYEENGEIVARITENGFVVIFKSSDVKVARYRISEVTDSLNLYIKAENKEDRPFFYTAVYNIDENDRNCELLLFNLRKNCNKLMGTNEQIIKVDRSMMYKATAEKALIERINRAFDNKEFKLYLQYIVKNKTEEIVSAEALSRWHDPERGIVSPGEYIGMMEKSGIIIRLDYYMFELVCRQLHKWRATENDNLTLSCNFTRITISEDNFALKINEIASRYVFDRTKLIIEITEDAIEKNHTVAMKNISKSKELGFRIALDDMGSGYTSFGNLCEYPIDVVKVDRDILLKTDKKNGRDLFVGLIALIHSLGFTVVCEGVETEEQNALVSATECDYIQGWYYSKALPEDEAEKFLKDYKEKLIGK